MELRTGASFFSFLVTILQSKVLSSSLEIPLNVESPEAPGRRHKWVHSLATTFWMLLITGFSVIDDVRKAILAVYGLLLYLVDI